MTSCTNVDSLTGFGFYSNGKASYEGNLKKSKLWNGFGSYYIEGGHFYRGQFKNGRKHG